ncbi:MAG: hypothetical protein Q4C42_08965 [Clostridia bacterium]|nr:hypothetical protein [Clostridia bacterium]
MNKIIRRMAAGLVTAAVIAASAVSSFAANPYTAISGGSTNFDKYLVMDQNSDVPIHTAQFTVTAGQYKAGSVTIPEVFAGIDASKVTATQTEGFKPGDKTYSAVQSGDTVELNKGEKYAVKTVKLDLSKVMFSEPGIYRYIITETVPNANTGITVTDGETRVVDVYVHGDENAKLKIAGYVLHDSPDDVALDDTQLEIELKDAGFTNTYTTYDLDLEKQVTGNQGNQRKYFKFTLNLSNADPGTTYKVNLDNAETTVEYENATVTNPQTIRIGDDGTATANFYLRDDQKVRVENLCQTVKYEIIETVNDNEGYAVSSVKTVGGAASKTNGKTCAKAEMTPCDNEVVYTNYRNGTVPTGLMVSAGPVMAGAGVILLGAGLFFVKRKLAK